MGDETKHFYPPNIFSEEILFTGKVLMHSARKILGKPGWKQPETMRMKGVLQTLLASYPTSMSKI